MLVCDGCTCGGGSSRCSWCSRLGARAACLSVSLSTCACVNVTDRGTRAGSREAKPRPLRAACSVLCRCGCRCAPVWRCTPANVQAHHMQRAPPRPREFTRGPSAVLDPRSWQVEVPGAQKQVTGQKNEAQAMSCTSRVVGLFRSCMTGSAPPWQPVDGIWPHRHEEDSNVSTAI